MFAHNFDNDIYTTYALELLLVPFYQIVGEISTYKFILIGFFFITLSVIIIKKITSNSYNANFLFFLFSTSLLSSIYTFGLRSETYIIPFMLVMVLQVFYLRNHTHSNFKVGLIGFLGAFIFLIHPASAIFTILLILYILSMKWISPREFSMIVGVGLLSVLLLSGFRLLDYLALFTGSNELDDHSFSFSNFIKYISFTPIVLSLLFFSMTRKTFLVKGLFIIGFVALTCAFGRSYYFSYTIPFILLFFADVEKIRLNFYLRSISLLFIGYGLYITHVFPTIQNIENPKLSYSYRTLLKEVDKMGKTIDQENKIWVSSQLGMEIIDQTNSRLHHHFYKTMSGEEIILREGDVMLFWNKNKIKERIKSQIKHNYEDLNINTILEPVKDHYKITRPFLERGSDIGLWSVSLK
jgi:hypothetical protein